MELTEVPAMELSFPGKKVLMYESFMNLGNCPDLKIPYFCNLH